MVAYIIYFRHLGEQTDIDEFKANLVYIKKYLASQGYKVRICLKNKTTERSQINNQMTQHRALKKKNLKQSKSQISYIVRHNKGQGRN